MHRLFGIPTDALAVGVAVAVGTVFAVVAALAARNRVFFRLAGRNVRRRRARTALIVLGLMLGTTIITSALTTGDTIAYAIRSEVLAGLGNVDEVVSAATAEGGTEAATYFDADALEVVRDAVDDSPFVDGVAPAIVEQVAMQDIDSRQTEPRVTLFATEADTRVFGGIQGRDGAVELADLAADEVLLNDDAADELDADVGDAVVVYAAGTVAERRIRDVVTFVGTTAPGPAALVPLADAQRLLDRPGELNQILVSNAGGRLSGIGHTDEVVALLAPHVEPLGLETRDVKRDGVDTADEVGSVFMSVFTTFGTFSIAAGVVLIFLVFVMLAAERRGEMGIARAIGTRRGHLVEAFVFEGAIYDVLAAAAGAVLGIGVALSMVAVMARAFGGGEAGFDIRYHVEPRSVVIGFGLGVVLTLVVIAVAAWRVSVLNIVTAIRNQPDPLVRRTRRASWARGLVGLAAAILLVSGGLAAEQGLPVLLGTSVALICLVPLARAVGVSQRLAYTVAGIGLVVYWLLPFDVLAAVYGDLSMDFSVWIVGGLLVVVGASWAIMYNADVILAALQRIAGRVRALAPVLKISVAYPLRSRFRTGVTLAMFTLVVFTLVVGATTTTAFNRAFDDTEAFGGGFDAVATVAPASPLDDPGAAVAGAGVAPGAVEKVARQSLVGAEVRQADAGEAFVEYPVRGLDDAFFATTTYGFAALADGYGSASEVWAALADDPTLAVVDPNTAPRRGNFSFGNLADLHLTGFFLEDQRFAPIPLEIRDPQTGAVQQLTVIGVLKDTAMMMLGVSTSQEAVESFGDRARPTTYLFDLAPGTDATAFARDLESAFLANGMQADAVADLVDEAVGASMTLNRLIFGFMGLGLLVGVAALGVISARAVVERRQHIGVLRAIGFQQRMVRTTFLLEASFIALTAIVVGTAIGLVMAFNIIDDQAQEPSWDSLRFTVPWLTLVVVFATVYVAALAATYFPARRGSRIYPAAALRYQ